MVKFVKIFRVDVLKNTSGQVVLDIKSLAMSVRLIPALLSLSTAYISTRYPEIFSSTFLCVVYGHENSNL